MIIQSVEEAAVMRMDGTASIPSIPVRDPDYIQDYISREPNGPVHPPKYVFSNELSGKLNTAGLIGAFANHTTGHGIPHYGLARGLFKKVFWSMAVAGCVATVLYNLMNVTRDYFSYQTDFTVQLRHAHSLVFPAVTVCNMNPLRGSALGEGAAPGGQHRRKRATYSCTSGWVEYNGHCYKVSNSYRTWSDGQSRCQNRGGDLVKIDDDAEGAALEYMAGTNLDDFWIGLKKSSGNWLWTDGSAVTYDNWASGEPDGSNCAKLVYPYEWRNSRCWQTWRFICEMGASVKSEPTTEQLTTETTTEPPVSTTQSTAQPTTTTVQTTAQATTQFTTTPQHTTTSTTAATTTQPTTTITTQQTTLPPTTIQTTTQFSTTQIITTQTTTTQTTTEATTQPTTQPVITQTTTEVTTQPTTQPVITQTTAEATTQPKTQPVITRTTTEATTQPIMQPVTTPTIAETSTQPKTIEPTSAISAVTARSTEPTTVDRSTESEATSLTSTPREASATTEDTPMSTDSVPELPTTDNTEQSTETTPNTTRGLQSEQKCCCTCCKYNPYLDHAQLSCSTCASSTVHDAFTCASHQLPDVSQTTPDTSPTYSSSSIPWSSSSTQGEPTRPVSTTVEPSTEAPDVPSEADAFQADEDITATMAGLSEESMAHMGFSLESLLLDCRYAGYNCNYSTFTRISNPVHGNCYVYNSGWIGDDLIASTRTGRRHGLHMILNVNQKEYLATGSDTAGFRLVIHSQDRMPFPEDEGITLSPGRATSISMRQFEMSHLSEPYGTCLETSLNHSDINVYEELYPVCYSVQACQKTCFQRNVIQFCGCGDPYYPLSGRALTEDPVTVCDVTNTETEECVQDVRRRFQDASLDCSCPKSCRSVVYPLQVSAGQWPSHVQKDEILSVLSPKIGESFDINDPTAYKQNLVKVEIFFDEFNYENIQERPKYKSGKYLSEVGGVLGLWVGFSIFTVVEVLELGLNLFVLALCGSRSCKR